MQKENEIDATVRAIYLDILLAVRAMTDGIKLQCDLMTYIAHRLSNRECSLKNPEFSEAIEELLTNINSSMNSSVGKITKPRTRKIRDPIEQGIESGILCRRIKRELAIKLHLFCGCRYARVMKIILKLGLTGLAAIGLWQIIKHKEKIKDAAKRFQKDRESEKERK